MKSKVTLVTGFVKSPEVGGHSLEQYIERSKFTLSLDVPMIIFTDSSLLDRIVQARENLKDKTVIKHINTIKYNDQVDKIRSNRSKSHPHGYPDPRNTPWYFIITMNKFTWLKSAIDENPYDSEYFIWLDFGYNQPDSDPTLITDIINNIRDKFSCCLIDYFSEEYALWRPDIFYQYGGLTTVAAGLFTAPKDIMLQICDKIEEEFNTVIAQGYGHSEQQLMYVLMLKYSELFDFYVGDYHCLLKNYIKPIDLSTTYNYLIPHILKDSNHQLLKKVIDSIGR